MTKETAITSIQNGEQVSAKETSTLLFFDSTQNEQIRTLLKFVTAFVVGHAHVLQSSDFSLPLPRAGAVRFLALLIPTFEASSLYVWLQF
jgi:hypothetical protein